MEHLVFLIEDSNPGYPRGRSRVTRFFVAVTLRRDEASNQKPRPISNRLCESSRPSDASFVTTKRDGYDRSEEAS
jgi:hypothetical protein